MAQPKTKQVTDTPENYIAHVGSKSDHVADAIKSIDVDNIDLGNAVANIQRVTGYPNMMISIVSAVVQSGKKDISTIDSRVEDLKARYELDKQELKKRFEAEMETLMAKKGEIQRYTLPFDSALNSVDGVQEGK